MRVISEPDLAVLLTRIAGRRELLTVSAAHAVVKRWRRTGLAAWGKPFTSSPAYVWLTAAGARRVSGADWREPEWPAIPHASAVARARLWLEAHPDPAMRAVSGSWVSEQKWREEHRIGKRVPATIPDGEMTNAAGHTIAVEVEIAPKGLPRTVDKVKRAATAFEWVLFLVQDGTQTARAVRSAILTASQEAGDDIARRVRMEVLPGRLDW